MVRMSSPFPAAPVQTVAQVPVQQLAVGAACQRVPSLPPAPFPECCLPGSELGRDTGTTRYVPTWCLLPCHWWCRWPGGWTRLKGAPDLWSCAAAPPLPRPGLRAWRLAFAPAPAVLLVAVKSLAESLPVFQINRTKSQFGADADFFHLSLHS